MPTKQRQTTAETRAACARHAASELLRWEYPADAGPDWSPTPQQVIDKTRDLYSWVIVTEDEAIVAIAATQARRITA